jgi:UDP-N-acetylmuramoyl-L-alanyl-D-glutamate--2,6-diaminopimelate ligase
MTTGLREPKNASESGKVVEERKLKTQQLKNRSLALAEIFLRTDASVPSGAKSLKIDGIASDSRKVASGYLFFALLGANEDGNRYVRDAIERGAVAIASEAAPPVDLPANVVWIQVAESRKCLAVAAANFFGRPAEALQLIAVTGTNGKTTTSSLIDSALRASGAKTGLFGTIAYHTPLGEYVAPNTTPESLDLQGLHAEISDAGGK